MQSKTRCSSVTDWSIVTRSIADWSITKQLKRLGVLVVAGATLLVMAGCMMPVVQNSPVLALQPLTLLSTKPTPTPTRKPSPTPTVKPRLSVTATAMPLPTSTATAAVRKEACTIEVFNKSSYPDANALFQEGVEALKRSQSMLDWTNLNQSAELAVDFFSQAIRLDPQFVGAYLKRVEATNQVRMETTSDQVGEIFFESMFDDLTTTISIKPACANLYLKRAMLLSTQRKLEEALLDLTQSISLDESYDAIALRGYVYYDLWKWDEALEDLNRAETVMPDDLESEHRELFYQIRGDLHYILEMWDEAIADHTRELEIDPDQAGGYILRGQAYLARGDALEAAKDFHQAATIDRIFTADALARQTPKIMELMATLDPDSEAYTQLNQIVTELGTETGLATCDEFAAKYTVQMDDTTRYLTALYEVEFVQWDLAALDFYEEVLNFYIQANKCFPDQFDSQLLINTSTVLHTQLDQATLDAEVRTRMEELIAVLDEVLQ